MGGNGGMGVTGAAMMIFKRKFMFVGRFGVLAAVVESKELYESKFMIRLLMFLEMMNQFRNL